MDSVYLHGAEDVRTASNNMRSAAEEMQQAARNIEGSLLRHQQFLDDWLHRLEQVMNEQLHG
jgi:hypothetical protein